MFDPKMMGFIGTFCSSIKKVAMSECWLLVVVGFKHSVVIFRGGTSHFSVILTLLDVS